jgi:hypothetical protein
MIITAMAGQLHKPACPFVLAPEALADKAAAAGLARGRKLSEAFWAASSKME